MSKTLKHIETTFQNKYYIIYIYKNYYDIYIYNIKYKKSTWDHQMILHLLLSVRNNARGKFLNKNNLLNRSSTHWHGVCSSVRFRLWVKIAVRIMSEWQLSSGAKHAEGIDTSAPHWTNNGRPALSSQVMPIWGLNNSQGSQVLVAVVTSFDNPARMG